MCEPIHAVLGSAKGGGGVLRSSCVIIGRTRIVKLFMYNVHVQYVCACVCWILVAQKDITSYARGPV